MAILLRVLGFVSPYLLIASLVWLGWIGVQNIALRHQNASLTTELATTRASLALAEANTVRLQAGLDRQNAALERLRSRGEAAMSATESRLQAFPDTTLPADWGAPLTGATACERAEEVRDRLMESLR